MLIGVVSNFDSRLRKILHKFSLSKYISVMMLSGEIGFEKPDKRIFEMAAKHMNIKNMSELLHIGDDEEKDFLGAHNAGAQALLFNPENAYFNSSETVIKSLGDIIDRI